MKVKTVVTRTADGIVIEVWTVWTVSTTTELIDKKVFTWYELINMRRGDT